MLLRARTRWSAQNGFYTNNFWLCFVFGDRPRPTPPPQRQGFGRGPSAAIIASPRNVVIEPVPRVARTTSSQEVDELFEGAPPAADDEGPFKY